MKNKQKEQQLEQSVIQKKIKKDVGKPIGLLKISLKPPDIWTVQKKEIQLISFFVNYGRHVCLHQAVFQKDLNKNKKNSIEKQQKIQDLMNQKEIYDKIEIAAKFLFEWNCSKRNVVYFFRNNTNIQQKYKNVDFKNEQWTTCLKNIKFLLNECFYQELQMIFKYFESNISDEEIGDILIDQSLNGQLIEVPQLVQNYFILLIKKETLSLQSSSITANYLEQLKTIFLTSIKQYKFILYQMIGNIRNIMQSNTESELHPSDASSSDQDWNHEIFFNSASY